MMNQTRLVDRAETVGDDEDDGVGANDDREISPIRSVRSKWNGETADAFDEAQVTLRDAEKMGRKIRDLKLHTLGHRRGDGSQSCMEMPQGVGALRRQPSEAGGFVSIRAFTGGNTALNGFYKLHSMSVPGSRTTQNCGDTSFADAGIGTGD